MPKPRKQLPLWSALAGSLVDLYVTGADRKPPSEFRLFAAGINHSDKGDFVFDDQAAEAVMSAYRQKGVDLMIDYDHQALATPQVGAPAAGWFSLEVRNGELWACNVRWTSKAAAHLEAAEYRYFSPLFHFEERTGRITSLINSALTNTPALHGIDALVAASAHTEDPAMEEELKKARERIAELERQAAAKTQEIDALKGQTATAALSTTVGLAASASAEEVRTRVSALMTFRKEILVIAGKDSEAGAIGALTAMRDQATEVVTLREKVEAAETAALAAEFGAHLDALSTKGADGKFLPPAARDKAEAMAKEMGGGKLTKPGIEKAKGFVALMCVSGEPSERPIEESNPGMALSAIEIEIASRTGTKLEDKKKYKEQRLAGRRA